MRVEFSPSSYSSIATRGSRTCAQIHNKNKSNQKNCNEHTHTQRLRKHYAILRKSRNELTFIFQQGDNAPYHTREVMIDFRKFEIAQYTCTFTQSGSKCRVRPCSRICKVKNIHRNSS